MTDLISPWQCVSRTTQPHHWGTDSPAIALLMQACRLHLRGLVTYKKGVQARKDITLAAVSLNSFLLQAASWHMGVHSWMHITLRSALCHSPQAQPHSCPASAACSAWHP